MSKAVAMRENPRQLRSPSHLLWQDTTPYYPGSPRLEPRCVTAHVGPLRILVVRHHVKSEGWLLRCKIMGSSDISLTSASLEDAKTEALLMVHEKLTCLANDVNHLM